MSKLPNLTAHLKLVFVGNDGRRYIIARSVQAKKGPKGQPSIKTLDSTISYKDETSDKMNCLSSKCADINTEMVRVLGVTEPILNYVLFCHQEDSNWPLEEASKVKQKFDEIFAASKFNEALKHVKDVRAAQLVKLRDVNKDLEHYSENLKVAKGKNIKKLL